MYSASMPSTPAMGQIWLQVASTAAHYVLVHPPGSVEEGFLETTLFLEPRFVMESTHPTLLNIGTYKVEQSVPEEKSRTSFTSRRFSAEFGSTLFVHSWFSEVTLIGFDY